MGLSIKSPPSPVSPLNTRHHLYFSSSGEDQEDIKLAPPDPCGAVLLAMDFHKLLKSSMESASHVQHSLEQRRIRMHNISERLPSLEAVIKSLMDMVTASKDLEQRIDLALKPSMSAIRLFDKVHRHEVSLSKGPKGDVEMYIQHMFMLKKFAGDLENRCPIAVESLQDVVRYVISGNCMAFDRFRLHKLHETSFALGVGQARQVLGHEGLLEEALRHLETEFRRILTKNVRLSTMPDDMILDDGGILNKSFVMPTSGMLDRDPVRHTIAPSPVVQLLEIIARHLSMQAQPMKSLEIYEEVRGLKLHESFQSLGPSYLYYMKPKALDALQWATLEEYIAMWNRHMYVFVEIFLRPERALFDSIFLSLAMEFRDCIGCFTRLAMNSGLGALLDFGKCFAKSQKEPQKIFKLLDMFKTLRDLHPSLQQLCDGDDNALYCIQELQRRIVHGACAVFWEFGLQVEVQRDGPVPTNGGVLKLVSYVINYLKYLLSDIYRDAIAEALRMEHGLRGGSMSEVELPMVILQIMEALQRNVEYRSQSIREPALSCVFRMNNYWYIYTRSENSNLGLLLGDDWLNEQRERVEHIALQYQGEAWSSVLTHLSMEGLQGVSDSQRTKELFCRRIEAFEEALADMHLKHSRWWFPSPELRQQIEVSVLELIVPAYQSYVINCCQLLQQDEFFHSQLNPEALEHMLLSLFQEKPTLVHKKF